MNEADKGPADRDTQGHGLAVFFATGLGAGFFPVAPGTVGALWGVPLAWGLEHLAGLTSLAPPYAAACQAVAVVALCAACIPVCTIAARRLGDKKDPGSIVLDEIASMPIAFYLVPLTDWKIAAAGFILHRLFDITKPPPARQLERLPAGLGIMADDCAAAVYANLALRAVLWLGWI
ncbi:MAG TPA: phosphatidylglycerophosphatase A [Pirellulales bacterium]|nr:phosphatidylglycerophosphatase A [Pirellulales bacterium]